jgi:Trk K+ transport system NAD-binding subunit
LIYSLYNAFYEILSSYSEETKILKNILDNRIKEISKIMCFITDQNNSIIVQTMSSDFNTLLINYSHKLIAQLNQTFEDMSVNQIDHLIISSGNNLNIILNNLNLQKFNIKNLIAISETLTANKLIWQMGQIRSELNRYLYFKKID